MGSIIKLIRINNLLVLGLTQILSYACLSDLKCFAFDFNLKFWLLILSTSLLAAAGYIINDYFDVKIDVLNKPDKLVVGTKISRRTAIILHLLFNVLAILIGLYISYKVAAVNILVGILLYFYSASLKRRFLIGNILVSLLMAAAIIIVWLFEKRLDIYLILFYSGFAFLLGLAREIIKDIEDIYGDEVFKSNSVPIVLGIPKTKILLYFIFVLTFLFLCLFMVYAYIKIKLLWTAIYLLAVVALPVIFFMVLLRDADRKKHFSNLSALLKIIMILGISSMLFRCL